MEYESFTLSNGIRIVHKHDSSTVANLGVLINAGSRDEAEHEHGIAHFIEHAIFKGTKKRKAFQVINRIEDVGGEINAYTTKEETCVYATFLDRYYERAIELFHDILFNSTFPDKELTKEKEVIIDEIYSYFDSPADLIYDDFEELLFANAPIGRNILGTAESIRKFRLSHIKKFIQNNYHTDQMVICSVGKIDFKKLTRFIQKYFSNVEPNIRTTKRVEFKTYKPGHKTINKDTNQVHCMIGNIAYDIFDNRKISLQLLYNLLGGPGLNSRLNITLREKNGFVYHVEAGYTPYSNTGIVNIYFGTASKHLDKSIELVYKELTKVKTKKLGTTQLRNAKRQLSGQLTIAYENKETLMLSMAKKFLYLDKISNFDEINKKIEAITSEQLLKTANEIFANDQLTTLIYK